MKNVNEIQQNGLLWINIAKPEEKVLRTLQKRFSLTDQEINESMPSFQRPKFVKRESYYFLVLHFPVFNRVTRRLSFSEVDFFLSGSSLITIHDNSLLAIDSFFNECQKTVDLRSKYFQGTAAHLFFEVLNRLLESTFPMLLHVNDDISAVDSDLFSKVPDQQMVKEILRLKTNVVTFRRSMQGHKTVLEHIVTSGGRELDLGSYQMYINTARDHVTEIWHTLESQKESVDALHETNESVSALRMNEIMRTLTVISVVTFPLTLVATIFSISAVDTPFVNLNYGFWIISGLVLVGALSMLAVFKAKKWID